MEPAGAPAGQRQTPTPPTFWQVVPAVHAIPQPPQLLLSTRVLVQVGPVGDAQTALFAPEQPQTPKPPWFWQVVPVESQSLPQLPQFWLFALRMTSQPLVGSLSQFAVPGLHTRMQAPESQVPVIVFGRPTQLLPQAPQFVASLATLMQRAAAPMPQASWPAGHAQTPIVQLDPVAQAFPHMPQFASLVCRFAQVIAAPVPQAVRPAGMVQSTRHMPIEQTWPIGQAVPQAPQFAALLVVSTQVAAAPVPQEV